MRLRDTSRSCHRLLLNFSRISVIAEFRYKSYKKITIFKVNTTTNIYNCNVQLAINWNGNFATEVCHRVCQSLKRVRTEKTALVYLLSYFCMWLSLIHFTLHLVVIKRSGMRTRLQF